MFDSDSDTDAIDVSAPVTNREKGRIVYDYMYVRPFRQKTQQELADEYGISQSLVSQIIQRYREIERTHDQIETELLEAFEQ